MRRWFVVRTHVHREQTARAHLQRQGYEVYLPQYLKRRRHARQVNWAPAPLFPRYLFIELDPEIQRWGAIRSTIGVSDLITNGEIPSAVPVGIVDDIRAREDATKMVEIAKQSPYQRGDQVQILNGALMDNVGFFDCMDDEERTVILLNLLGREMHIRLPAWVVTARA